MRHQAALQAICEPADDALEMGKLLVEEGTQAVELSLFAEIFSGHHFIELAGENLVVAVRRQAGERQFRADRFSRGFCLLVVVLAELLRCCLGGFHLALLLVIGSLIGLLGLALVLAGRFLVVALAVVLIVLRLVVVVAVVGIFRLVLAKLIAHVESGDQVAYRFGECGLV